MFEVGDRVECLCDKYATGKLVKGGEYTVIYSDDGEYIGVAGGGDNYLWGIERFKLVKEKQQFDLKKNPWFIRTGTKEKSEACQKWLFEQGVGWVYFGKQVNHYGENSLTNVRDDGEVVDSFMHAQKPHESAKEIILEFETVVKSVTYPSIETEQDKKIKELKETIDKAQQQLEEIMSK